MIKKNALVIKNIVKQYKGRRALDGLSLYVPRGSLFGLVGSNGAGKTTAMGITAGLLRANSGTINVLEDGPFDPAIHSGRLSLLPQDSELPLEAIVTPLLTFYAQLQGITHSRAADEVNKVLQLVNLSDRAQSAVRTLSHGMKRRVVIAQALIGDPELVLLDEPLSGLDPGEVVSLRRLLKNKKKSQTIVISSHNLHEIEQVCDQIAFIEQGKTIRQDTVEKITGSSHVLSYRTDENIPYEKLRSLLPDTILEESENNHILTAHCDTTKDSVKEINSIILKHLIESGCDVLEMRQGSELESIYMKQKKD